MHPREELSYKMVWMYGLAPYVLAYHAVGAKVTLCLIWPGRPSCRTEDLVALDLSLKTHRVRNLIQMIKLCPLLMLIRKTINQERYDP